MRDENGAISAVRAQAESSAELETRDEPNTDDSLELKDARLAKSGASRRAGVLRALGFAVIGCLLGVVMTWGVLVVTKPPAELPPEPEYVTVVATPGVVERTSNLNALASWPTSAELPNQAVGVVTRVGDISSGNISPGTILYWVGERPVFVAQGKVPAFRSLQVDSQGEDVAQAEQFLADLGYTGFKVDQKYTADTARAVKQWQKDQGLEQTGVIDKADLIFFETLPARAIFDTEALQVGKTLTGGEPIVKVLSDQPKIVIRVDRDQASNIPAGTTVNVSYKENTWQAVIAQVNPPGAREDFHELVLTAPDGSPLCGDTCNLLPTSGNATLRCDIQLIPKTEGITIPSAAIQTDSAGGTFVIDQDGETKPVKVVAGWGGTSVVEGVADGEIIRVLR